jgi:hypothetical protein
MQNSIESVDKISKPKIKVSLGPDLPKKDCRETSSRKKIYQYVPSNQRKNGNQYLTSYTKHPKMKVLIFSHLYHL